MSNKNLWQRFLICEHPEQKSCKLTIHFEPGIDTELRKKYIKFVRWLRKTYYFPTALSIYILNSERIRLKNGTMAYGSFKWFKKRPPLIRIPSVVEKELLNDYCVSEIHEMIISSLIHEITHYFQWATEAEQSNAVSERQANYYRYKILEEFYEDNQQDASV